MELDDLAGNRHVIPLLAEWHVQQWQHLYPVWNVEAAIGEFEAMTGDGTPHTIVAFDRGGRSLDDVVGSVSIIDDDELAGFEGVGPWLASLYVRPAFRGAGVGRRLVAAAVDFARVHGIDRLYLFNSDTAEFYERLGWGRLPGPRRTGIPSW